MSAPSFEAERAVIGALLLEPSWLEKIRAVLDVKDFETPEYAAIYQAAMRCADEGVEPDFITVRDHVDVDVKVLMDAAEAVPTTRNTEIYTAKVKDAALRRSLADLGAELTLEAQSGGDTFETLAKIRRMSDELAAGTGDGVITSGEALMRYIDYRQGMNRGDKAFVPSGFRDLDDILGGGFVNTGLYIIASRPGMGKTTLAAAIADNAAAAGRKVLLYSLEMSVEQMSARRIGRAAAIPYSKLMLGQLEGEEYERLMKAASELSGQPFFMRAGPLAAEDVRRGMIKHKPDIVMIDYLGLMTMPKKQNRYEAVTELSGELKRIAMEFKVPVVAMAQLNRENTLSRDKRPKLQHLRDSGAVEQDADGVIMLHRPSYYEDEPKESHEVIELIVPKNRHGRTGTVSMLWYGATGVMRPIWKGGTTGRK